MDFTEVFSRLKEWKAEAVSQLHAPEAHTAALMLKRQIDDAIACLELCQQLQITPGAKMTVLPDLKTMSPSCFYRIAEDNETDDQSYWTELAISGYHLELSPGDIVIEIAR